MNFWTIHSVWTLSLNSLSIGSMSLALLKDGERDSQLGYARYIYHSIIFGEVLFYLNLRIAAQLGSTHLPNTISLVKLSEVMIPKLYTHTLQLSLRELLTVLSRVLNLCRNLPLFWFFTENSLVLENWCVQTDLWIFVESLNLAASLLHQLLLQRWAFLLASSRLKFINFLNFLV